MKKKLFYIVVIIALLIFIVSSAFAIINKPEKLPEEGNYKAVHEVSGIVFNINSILVNKATAISEISENIEIEPNLYYIYKDGERQYLLFSLNAIVIAVEKGTSFHFEDYSNKEEAIGNSSVAGLWMEKNGSKFKYEEGSPFIANVNAGLVITNDMYNDFVGQLAVITDGATEWSMFVGVPGTGKFKDLPENTQKNITGIVSSINLSSALTTQVEEEYAVVIGTNEVENVEVAKKTENTDVNISEPSAEPAMEGKEEIDVEEVQEEQPEVSEKPQESETVEVTEVPSTSVEEVPEETPVATTAPAETQEASPSPAISQPTAQLETAKTPIKVNNQKKIMNKSSDKAYTSDIYTMLDLKDNGLIAEYDIETGEIVNPIISMQRVYTGQTALKMIKEYCAEEAGYNFFDAPTGCTWHIAEYYLSYKNCAVSPYINIKIKGMDGNQLNYKGITYAKRTYDMKSEISQEGDFSGPYYCYYAVPNGCPDYVLECGTGNIDIDNAMNKAAYYLIHTN